MRVVFLWLAPILTCASRSCNNDRNIDFSILESIFLNIINCRFNNNIEIKTQEENPLPFDSTAQVRVVFTYCIPSDHDCYG